MAPDAGSSRIGEVNAIAIDPVCKMDVDEGGPPGGTTEHEGQTYYFCAPGCRRVFERNPEKYLGS